MKKVLLLLKVLRRQLLFTLNFKKKINKDKIRGIKKIFFLSSSFNSLSVNYESITNYIYFYYNPKNINSLNPNPGQQEYITNEFSIPCSNANFYLFDQKTISLITSISKTIHYVGIPFFFGLKNVPLVLWLIANKQIYISKFLKVANKRYFILERVDKKVVKQTRRYIPYQFSRKTFMQHLYSSNINAVMLRWFDKIDFLGDIKEDIDILVANDSISNVLSILESKVGVLPIDLYSVSGDSNTDFGGLLYFPKDLSITILKNKTVKNGFYIPDSKGYLMSIMYHAVFHKGVNSGIPVDDLIPLPNNELDHNYSLIIKDLLVKNKIETSFDLVSLSALLKNQGYYPSYDLMLKLKHINKENVWLESLISIERDKINKKCDYVKGLSVLFIREKGFKLKSSEKIEDFIRSFGFYIIKQGEILKDHKDRVIREVRGGNWGNGPFDVSGGTPEYYYIIYDPFFVAPNGDLKTNYPSLENKKIHDLKLKLRSLFILLTDKESFNGVHSSDDFYESINHLEILGFSKEEIYKIIQACLNIELFYKSKYRVISNLSRNSLRSKIELIEFQGRLAIKKTFNKYSSRFLKREISFMKKFKDYDFVPKLFKQADNYFISEYFENYVALEDKAINLSEEIKEQLYNIFKTLHENEYCIVDLNPSNVLCSSNNELKIIDFEFATQVEQPKNLIDSYDLNKLPKNIISDFPLGYGGVKDNYAFYWEQLIGLKKRKFIAIYCKKSLE
ncbi:hypothetical protein BFR04_07240 [Gaetbulibacter sp. 4G1]|nr:protein kinase family protein [Gaetbulibacter sp. 4G1]PIA78018.1 hypothetical protein BFR04_07240 [Gaetbulibacter sp. 4G1]